MSNSRSRHLHIRYNDLEGARWARAATASGHTLSAWVRHVCEQAATVQAPEPPVVPEPPPAPGKRRHVRLSANATASMVPLPPMTDPVWSSGLRHVMIGHAISNAFMALQPR